MRIDFLYTNYSGRRKVETSQPGGKMAASNTTVTFLLCVAVVSLSISMGEFLPIIIAFGGGGGGRGG